MLMRAAVLTDEIGFEQGALQAALRAVSANVDVRALHAPGQQAAAAMEAPADGSSQAGWRWLARLPFGAFLRLASWRPDLVISEAFGPKALQAALYRSLFSRSRLLLCATKAPRHYGMLARLVLRRADGFLAHGDDVADAVEQLRFPASRIYAIAKPADLELFLACPRDENHAAAHRMIYAGELSPDSGAADFLICLAAWAEQHPDRSAELWWAGDGDLSGVLEAQPLPDNITQRFLGRLDRRGIASAFAECGILVVPPFAENRLSLVPEALAAGLVVLGSRRSAKVRQVVGDGVLGWTFDPLRPDDILAALTRALGSSEVELDRMRENGRGLLRRSASESFTERMGEAIAAVLSSGLPDAGAAKSS